MLATVVPAAVQNWMDPFHQDKEVRALCAEHGESAGAPKHMPVRCETQVFDRG